MKTANYSELRSGLKSYLDTVVENNEPLIIHRPSNTSVVVISLEDYNAMIETAYITSSPAMMKRISDAEKDIAEGKGRLVDIDTL